MIKEIEKKKKILDNKKPFNEAVIKNLKQYFNVDLTYNSNTIEGNTLTIIETKVILEDGITIGKGKTMKEHLEVIIHKEAIDYVEAIVNRNIDIEQNVIKDLYYIILKSINNENAGRYRNVNVLISSKHRPQNIS